jgi:hypothetical protein
VTIDLERSQLSLQISASATMHSVQTAWRSWRLLTLTLIVLSSLRRVDGATLSRRPCTVEGFYDAGATTVLPCPGTLPCGPGFYCTYVHVTLPLALLITHQVSSIIFPQRWKTIPLSSRNLRRRERAAHTRVFRPLPRWLLLSHWNGITTGMWRCAAVLPARLLTSTACSQRLLLDWHDGASPRPRSPM